MRVFECQNCDQPLYFENVSCERCGMRLGFGPARTRLFAIEPQGDHWIVLGEPDRPRRLCANAQHGVCNWLVDAEGDEPFCLACRHNNTIPDLTRPHALERWTRLEQAKRRLFYTLINLRLPLITRAEDPKEGLAFDFLEELEGGPRVMTGHASGLITINIAEADDVERERARTQMMETYRTLLGHMRHEIAHWYWDRLVRDDPATLERFRALCGDERADYAQALQAHHDNGPKPDWRANYVTAYASSHPWEDFAESFAHYLHIVDALETARAFGVSVRPRVTEADDMSAKVDFNPYRMRDAQALIDAWLPIAFAVNSLNRSLGQPDLYPFVLSPPAIEKLGFVASLAPQGA
ncbi:MAG TPA: putative zinc-binding peptidase [Beijerinckiaceae bacterium]|jgi:hypothetical protein